MDLGWCTIDLISEEDLGEDGSFSQFELARICPVDLRSCEIRREEIRRERDTLELVAKDMSKRLDRERLPKSRNSLDEDVSSSEERDDDATDEVILTDDRSPNLIFYVREYLANVCECWIHSRKEKKTKNSRHFEQSEIVSTPLVGESCSKLIKRLLLSEIGRAHV